jgi:acylphosphatase
VNDDEVRMDARIDGQVQGVGFRWWTRAQAGHLGLSGVATNLDDGSVRIVAEGPRGVCTQLLDLVRGDQAPGTVRTVRADWSDASGEFSGFAVD